MITKALNTDIIISSSSERNYNQTVGFSLSWIKFESTMDVKDILNSHQDILYFTTEYIKFDISQNIIDKYTLKANEIAKDLYLDHSSKFSNLENIWILQIFYQNTRI